MYAAITDWDHVAVFYTNVTFWSQTIATESCYKFKYQAY